MKTNKHLISKFLAGELDSAQAADFEKAILRDSILRREVDLYEDVDNALRDTEILDLRFQLNELHEPVLQELGMGTGKGKRVVKFAITAASFLVLLGIGITGFVRNSGDIVDKFYSPYAMSMVTRSVNANVDQILQEALLRYDNQQYREAVILFEKVLNTDPEIISAQLYAGISYLEIKEYNHAETSLNKVIEHNDNLFVEQAEWYMGFCYLMTDRRERALRQFSRIAEENGYFSDKAKDIIKKLG